MKRWVLAIALTSVLAPRARAGDMLQADPKTFDLEGAKRVRIEFPVGKLTVQGDDGQTVRVLVRVDCKGTHGDECREQARRVRIDHEVDRGVFRLEFTGVRKDWSGNHITVHSDILLPRAIAAQLNMGVGKADVTGLESDLDLELGVGELTVRAHQSDYRDAESESGVGDATIETRSGRIREKGFIGHTARWSEGNGRGFIRAHVGVGASSVDLR